MMEVETTKTKNIFKIGIKVSNRETSLGLHRRPSSSDSSAFLLELPGNKLRGIAERPGMEERFYVRSRGARGLSEISRLVEGSG